MNLNKSFVGVSQGMRELMKSNEKRAHYQFKKYIILNRGENVSKCDLIFVWQSKDLVNWAMGIKKGSKYKNALNKVLLRMDESGQLRKLREKYYPKIQTCKQDPSAVSFKKVVSLFMILIVAFANSVLIFVVEYTWYKYFQK